ncbi:ZINC-FINGER HOMEODOMAIN PROTEIN 4-LIKE [Salix purpurea]|uniref:ZINC-FINGER HOMEODOMAIN PROTEIN 4-LIKE n=1 Tax=Salix purpurea TaxID=77065 RepID=A0A9Q0TGJ3_SALPP|nr:ZINC-FINGER HOMEODOMAIN PROTEIN 4-LIKE [Salix purpurea]
MELSSHEGGIPIPLNSTFGGAAHGHGHGHLILHDHPAVPHNHNIISSAAPQIPISNNGGPSLTAASIDDSHVPYKKMVRYRECLKNHAASMGGTATDGCGEFMPSGEEGSIEALTCSACNCHRNFHRKEIEGEHGSCTGDHCYHINNPHFSRVNGRKVILGHHKSILAPAEALCYPTAAGALIPSRSSAPHHQMIMSYNMGSFPSESDEQEDGGGAMMARPAQLMKKRFRTKFSQEQKEKMLNFAEKVGWKLQKQEETVVQQFCQEIGVKRRVLKVWMHNNKHSLAKMNPSTTTATATTTTTTTS